LFFCLAKRVIRYEDLSLWREWAIEVHKLELNGTAPVLRRQLDEKKGGLFSSFKSKKKEVHINLDAVFH
jgi:hypothetical protein